MSAALGSLPGGDFLPFSALGSLSWELPVPRTKGCVCILTTFWDQRPWGSSLVNSGERECCSNKSPHHFLPLGQTLTLSSPPEQLFPDKVWGQHSCVCSSVGLPSQWVLGIHMKDQCLQGREGGREGQSPLLQRLPMTHILCALVSRLQNPTWRKLCQRWQQRPMKLLKQKLRLR